jgi:hypothetical protein
VSKRELAAREFRNLMDHYFAYDDFHLGVFPLMKKTYGREDAVDDREWNKFEAKLLELILKQIPPELPNEL